MWQFDTRGIKEEPARESAKLGMNGTPSFYEEDDPRVISIQIEKNRRGKNLRTCFVSKSPNTMNLKRTASKLDFPANFKTLWIEVRFGLIHAMQSNGPQTNFYSLILFFMHTFSQNVCLMLCADLELADV
jgi:hypothetical protein